MNTLVTGGLGFIGSHIVNALIKRGHCVRILDNLERKLNFDNYRNINFLSPDTRKNIELVIGDIRDINACMKACSGIDIVFHNAAIASVGRTFANPKEAYLVNVIGTKNLLETSVKTGIERFVFSSSGKIYGNVGRLPSLEEDYPNPTTPYGVTKYEAEKYCKQFSKKYELNVISLRYFSVYGPWQTFKYGLIGEVLGAALNGGYASLHALEKMERDFTYIDDVVDANLLCLDYPGTGYDVFNIGSGNSNSIKELRKLISEILKKEVILTYKQLLQGTVIKTHADISKARRRLSYQPRVSLDVGLGYTVNWLKENNYSAH